jgi:hypothetical protein
MRRVLVALLLVVAAAPLSAQKRCKKGIPCGNTCIAANKVCHVGTPAATAAPAPATTPSPSTNDAPWVGSSRGRTYYRAGCAGAKKLAPQNLITFKSEAEAKRAGYVHSTQKGC